MKFVVEEELIDLLSKVLAEDRSEPEWAEVESDDLLQTNHYVGGFDATEMAFCFSRYDGEIETWFQLTLDEVRSVVAGDLTTIEHRLAKHGSRHA
jgi:ethanolamine utilization protein EutQ (cupin superfamily)